MKRSILKDAICKLKAAGWRIYLDGRSPDGVDRHGKPEPEFTCSDPPTETAH